MSDFVIETKKLTKIYGEQTAVSSVDIHVKPGRIYGLLGRNGAGKTTIMKMILGLTPITSGEVDVFGQNIKGHEKRIYPRIGAIIETPGFYPNLTGTENLEIFAKLRGTPRPNAVKNALEVVGLPYRDKKLFSKYSLGMKQRLGIANAILHNPSHGTAVPKSERLWGHPTPEAECISDFSFPNPPCCFLPAVRRGR